jgi:hypothetical protein
MLRQPGVDDEHAFVRCLHGDVSARADEQVHVPLHVEGVDLSVAAPVWRRRPRGRPLLSVDALRKRQGTGQGKSRQCLVLIRHDWFLCPTWCLSA